MAHIRTATGPIKLYMRLFGFKGWASFWNTVYMWPGYETDRRLLAHEFKHLEQIERDGVLKFSIKYLWWTLRYGYKANPYEAEARQAERTA
jgi:hypothetical protein